MTIASEITRLQNDKEAMRQSIINKGVDVDVSVNFDDYASCIDAIQQGGGTEECYELDYLVVAGGGGGSSACSTYGGGGGGAGGVVEGCCKQVPKQSMYSVTVGQGGRGGKYGTSGGANGFECCLNFYGIGRCGGDSGFGTAIAKGGGGGGNCYYPGFSGGSGGGTSTMFISSGTSYSSGISGGGGIYPQGFQGAFPPGKDDGGGGGGAGGPAAGYRGGMSRASCISGSCKSYSCGGFGSCCTASSISCQPTYEGSGGSGIGRCCQACDGKAGVVIVRYPTSCGYNFTGGCKYTCGNYTVHCFTSNGALYSVSDCEIGYLAVGGGEGGCYGGGGGGDVKLGTIKYDGPLCVTIGNGGTCGNAGGDTTIGDKVVAKGGHCGLSGNNNLHSCGYGNSGGGGVFGPGDRCGGDNVWSSRQIGGNGGFGILGYGGGGGGTSPNNSGGYGRDGGGHGQYGCGTNATNCGGGGGGGACYYSGNYYYKGGDGVVDICYPADGSFGFTTATGGNCCYTCNGICVHRFTSNGTFTIVS